MSLGTLAADIVNASVGMQATRLPASSTPIRYDFGAQASNLAATGSVNKTDLTKALGEQIKAEKTVAGRSADTQEVGSTPVARTINNRLQPAARGPYGELRYHRMLSERTGYTPARIQQKTTQPGANRAAARIRRVRAEHQPATTMAEVNKRIASMGPSVPNSKTVLINEESLQRVQPNRTRQVARFALRAAAEVAPSPAALAIGIVEAIVAPQARRPQARNNLSATYARLRAPIHSPNFG